MGVVGVEGGGVIVVMGGGKVVSVEAVVIVSGAVVVKPPPPVGGRNKIQFTFPPLSLQPVIQEMGVTAELVDFTTLR